MTEDAHTFLLVLETGSFTAAAQRLTLPISSVSRRVARLEQRLGLQLLRRTTRSLHLTPAGELYATEMRELTSRMQLLEGRLSAMASEPAGLLRVTTPSGFSTDTGAMLSGFLHLYPKVELQLMEEDRFVDLVAEGIDAALRGSAAADPGVVSEHLMVTKLQLYASPGYLASRKPIEDLADLAFHEFVLGSAPQGETWTLYRGDSSHSVKAAGRFTSKNLNARRNAALWGMGVVLLPEMACRRHILAGELSPVLPEYRGGDASMWLLYPNSRYPSPALEAFVSFVKAQPWAQLNF